MATFNECDVRNFIVGGPCIIRVRSDDPETNGFWFGEIVSLDMFVTDEGTTPRVIARCRGGRLNRIGIPMSGADDGACPPGEHEVLPFTDTTIALCAEIAALEASYTNETSSLRASLERAKTDARAMEHMHLKAFTELCELKERMGEAVTTPIMRRTVPVTGQEQDGPPACRAAKGQRPCRAPARGPGSYSLRSDEIVQGA